MVTKRRASEDWDGGYEQQWSTIEQSAQVINEPMPIQQSGTRARKRTARSYRIAALLVVFFSIVQFAVPALIDYLTIRNANPTMLQLAHDAHMTRKGELVFLKTNPQLVSDTKMGQVCPDTTTNNAGFIEQGCFVSSQNNPATGRIYLREMPTDLHKLEISTAAYEMLHPVYASLTRNASDAATLNKLIESNYSSVNDTTLNATVALFAKTEPGERDNELFSLLGTEYYGKLSTSLQAYYTAYLSDPSVVVDYNNQVNNLFQADQNQLNSLQTSINIDDGEATAAYKDSVRWADEGNAYEDSLDYNMYSQDINAENVVIDQYNSLIQTYNTLVSQFNGRQVSPIQSAQSQGSE